MLNKVETLLGRDTIGPDTVLPEEKGLTHTVRERAASPVNSLPVSFNFIKVSSGTKEKSLPTAPDAAPDTPPCGTPC